MNPRVLEAINKQINSELSASYAYLAMSAYCECQKFTGAARWLRLQSQEENMHAMKLFDFVLARNQEARLSAIAEPRAEFASVVDLVLEVAQLAILGAAIVAQIAHRIAQPAIVLAQRRGRRRTANREQQTEHSRERHAENRRRSPRPRQKNTRPGLTKYFSTSGNIESHNAGVDGWPRAVLPWPGLFAMSTFVRYANTGANRRSLLLGGQR